MKKRLPEARSLTPLRKPALAVVTGGAIDLGLPHIDLPETPIPYEKIDWTWTSGGKTSGDDWLVRP